MAWELARHRQRTISDVRYRVELSVPASRSRPVTGSTRISFRWSDPDRHPLVVDFKDPGERVASVRVNGDSVGWRAEADHVVISGDALRPDAENEVRLEYEAGDEALNRHDDFLYTLFVPDRAHFSLPLFDQPNLKGRFSLVLQVPEGWSAVSNGPGSRTPEAGDLTGHRPLTLASRTVTFAETEPLPTYLFAFAAGEFRAETAERAGREMTLYHRETDSAKVARNREAIFDLHETALEWLEAYTAIPYPFQKFDFVLIPDFQYNGMEHPGQILYRASSLFLDESATQSQELGRASLIAHETAHIWFGDLVTMDWFDDVWTKEVYANFMAAKIVHPSFPEVDHDLRFLLAHHPSAYEVDRTAGANPIRQPLENLREAGTLYGAIIYQKAPVVMRQLERLVGEETFRDGLREYLAEHAYGNATWPELIALLDARTDEDLAEWSRMWVEEPGRPRISARVVTDSAGRVADLVVSQEDMAGEGRTWPQPLEVLVGTEDGMARHPIRLSGSAASVEGLRGQAPPEFVLPNGSGLEYGHVHLDGVTHHYLMSHLPGIEDALVRGIGWVTLWDALLEGEVEPESYLDLALRGLESEENEQILQWILGTVEAVFWTFLSDSARQARAPEVEEALWTGLENAEGSSRRAAFFNAYRDVVTTPDAVGVLREVWEGETEVPGVTLSESDHARLAQELAVRGVEGWEEILAVQADRIENPDRKARFEFVRPALDVDPAGRERFFESLREASNREREPWVLAAVGYLHHPLRRAHARELIEPGLALVEEIQRTGDIFFPKRWLDATLGGHNTPEAARTVRAFLEARPDYPPRLRAKILQSADRLFRAAEVVYGNDGEEEGGG